jgi:hypothetical protein
MVNASAALRSRRPGQAKREPGPQKDMRFNLLQSRIRLRLSGTTIYWRLSASAGDTLASFRYISLCVGLRGNGVGGKIFINYRRRQSLAEAQHLATLLAKEFGARRVFIDVRGIDGFSNWFETLKQQVEGTAAMISVVGKDWLSALDAKDHPPGETTKDFVRFEIAEALRRNVPVLPVLLDGAAMPLSSQLPAETQGMLLRQGMKLRGEEFPEHAAAIVKQLKKLLAEAENGKGVAPWKAAALSAAAFAFGIAAGPTVLTHMGIIQPSSDPALRAALHDAQRQASEADAQYKAALRERDQAATAKLAAEKEARAAAALAASEQAERKAVEARLADASSKLKAAEKRLEEKEANARLEKAGTAPQPMAPADRIEANRAAKPLTAAEEAALKPKDEFQECENCPEMVAIPADSFTMGSPDTEEGRDKNEGPQHKVTIPKPFAVGKYTVTSEAIPARASLGRDDEGEASGFRDLPNPVNRFPSLRAERSNPDRGCPLDRQQASLGELGLKFPNSHANSGAFRASR